MRDPITQKIYVYVDEFFPMRKGEMIIDPTEEILLANNIKIRRMALKHIVESRKDDGYSLEAIKDMSSHIIKTVLCSELNIVNTNKKYPNSRIIGRAYPCEGRALLILYQPDEEIKVIYNFYYREINRFKRMK